jgi:hypothetical protein
MQLLCIGDVAPTDQSMPSRVWTPPGGIMPGDQARVLFNWELPVGDTINPKPRFSGPRLLTHPDAMRAIQQWSPGFATLATNHILDAGEKGLSNTIDSLQGEGFTTVGAGLTQEEITRPLFWETPEGALAVVNWVFPETHPDWMAVPGPNCWPGLDSARRTIQKLKSDTDWLMIVVHWSDEHFPYPRPDDRVLACELAQTGADMIIGHHPHVVRGMEIIRSCPVFYSIGNFYFSNFSDHRAGPIVQLAPRHREGLGVQVSFRRGKRLECEILSFRQTGMQVVSDASHRAARRMKRVSRPLQTCQGSAYNRFYRVKRVRFNKWGGRWHFGFRRLGIRGSIQRLLRHAHFMQSQGF